MLSLMNITNYCYCTENVKVKIHFNDIFLCKRAQILAMTEAWEWSENDVILHVLPLHHVHGIINVLCCPLYVGATCYMQKRFDAAKVE